MPSDSIPAFFKCPISLDLMHDPVSLSTGVSYDRSSIETWLAQGHDTCPATMRTLHDLHLTPNHTLRRLIQQWCIANPSYCLDRIPSPPRARLDPHQLHLLCSHLNTPSERIHSLQQLRSLAKDSESNRRCIKAHLSPTILVDLIRSEAHLGCPDMEIVQEGLGLLNLLPMDAACKGVMTDSPQLQLIARVLQRGSLEARLNAAQLVEALAEEKYGKARVGEEDDILEGLIELLKQENEQANAAFVKASLKALWNVTQTAKNRVKVAEFKGASVISALVEKLPGAERAMVERVMAVLDTLSSCAEGRAAISSHALAIPSVVRCLLVVSEVATEHAVGVLWSVCINSAEEELLQEALQLGVVKKLLLIVQIASFSPRTLQKAKDLLRLFSNVSDEHCSSEEI